MEDKFITEKNEILLSRVRTNFTEENSRFKDSVWTKYTLPTQVFYDRDFLRNSGQFSSINNAALPFKEEGYHVFEGKIQKGIITYSDIGKKKCTVQIDSGFEELPNFEKKLNELPVEYRLVNNIYDHANEIVSKKYPETNYNFPRLYTDSYDLDTEGWRNFESFINDRRLNSATNSKTFTQNEVIENTNGWDVVNRNIIQPLPYLIHVLKVGFLDAGFVLQGDILDDPRFKQRLIYSAEQYYNTGDQKYFKTYVYAAEFFDNDVVAGQIFGHWTKKFKIDAPGKYRIIGNCFTNQDGNSSLVIKRNGVILNVYGSSTNSSFLNFDKVIEVGIDEAEDLPEISLEFFGRVFFDRFNVEGVNIGVADIKINPMRENTTSGDPIPFVFNFNRVDLKRALPDMTFGELTNRVKNWGNFDLVFQNNTAIMNRIIIDKTKEPEDFKEFEVEDPPRNRNEKQYFNLKFPDIKDLEIPDIFFNENGYELNKTDLPKETTEISIEAFCLPLETFRGVKTAKVYDESNTLMLVFYEGLDENGDNHAKNPAGLHGIELAESVKDWFLNRLRNWVFKWTFKILKSKMRKFNIKSEILAYNKKHWIKSWVKNSVSNEYYSVDIETETF